VATELYSRSVFLCYNLYFVLSLRIRTKKGGTGRRFRPFEYRTNKQLKLDSNERHLKVKMELMSVSLRLMGIHSRKNTRPDIFFVNW